MHSKGNQKKKKKKKKKERKKEQRLHIITYMWNLKNKMNK